MKGKTIRLLMVALGIGGFAGAAVAQDLESTASAGMGGQVGMAKKMFGRSAASAQESEPEDVDPGYAMRQRHVRQAPRYDDESDMRTTRRPSGPDDELAGAEMARLGSERRRAIEHDRGSDEVRRVESEMDRLDERMAPRAKAKPAVQPPASRHDEDAPMRSHYPRKTMKRKMAPFSDDPSGEKEQTLASRDPRHAYRPRPKIEGDETPSIRVTPRGKVSSKAAPQAEEETQAAADGGPGELMAIERQIMMMKRKGTSEAKLEALEAKASALRASWRESRTADAPAPRASKRQAAPGVSVRRTEQVRQIREPADPAPSPFWRGGNRTVDAPAEDQEAEATYRKRPMERPVESTSAEAPMERTSFNRPVHL